MEEVAQHAVWHGRTGGLGVRDIFANRERLRVCLLRGVQESRVQAEDPRRPGAPVLAREERRQPTFRGDCGNGCR